MSEIQRERHGRLSRTAPEERARRKRKRNPRQPPDRYYESAGVRVGATRQEAERSFAERCDRLRADTGGESDLNDATHAFRILSAYYAREEQRKTLAAEESEAQQRSEARVFYPPAVRAAYERLGLAPGTELTVVAATYQSLTDRALREGRNSDGQDLAAAARTIERFVERQADRAVVVEMRTIDDAPPPREEKPKRKDPLAPHLALLKLAPDPKPEAVDLAYATALQQYREPLSPADQQQVSRLRRAHRIVRRTVQARRLRIALMRQRRKLISAFLTLTMCAAVLVYTNVEFLRAAATHFQPGDVLYVKRDGRKFGTVVAYEPEHRFPGTGRSVAAYKVRLSGSGTRVWVARPVLVEGTRAVAWQESQQSQRPATPPRS